MRIARTCSDIGRVGSPRTTLLPNSQDSLRLQTACVILIGDGPSLWCCGVRCTAPPAKLPQKRRSNLGGSVNSLKRLAGAGGFEPPHGGIKVRCLTTWLRPNGPSGGAARPHIVGHTLGSNPSRIVPEYVVQNGRSVACRLRCRAAATALAGALLEGYKAALAQHNPLHGVFGRCPFGLTVGRSVAQPGSALASGARGREFESPRSDQQPLERRVADCRVEAVQFLATMTWHCKLATWNRVGFLTTPKQ